MTLKYKALKCITCNKEETSTKFAAKMQQKGEEHGEKIILLLPFVSRNIWRFFEDNASMSSIRYFENHAS